MQKIQLYKIREFGEKINITIEYIRYNIGPLLKIVLLIAAPVGLLFGILFSNFFGNIFAISANPNMSQAEALNMLGTVGTNYFLMMLLSTITVSFLVLAIYGYMKLNDTQEEKPTVMEVYGKILPKVPMMAVLMIFTGIVSSIGFLFFLIPGIYLMITLSLALPIYLFEEESIGKAFSKSFRLVKGKWWSTFGLLFIAMLIATVASYAFAIPFYLFSFGEIFTLSESNDPQAAFAIFSSWYAIAGMAFMMIGSYITYLVPIIALGFQYFNLSERVEGKGIRNQIQQFETLA